MTWSEKRYLMCSCFGKVFLNRLSNCVSKRQGKHNFIEIAPVRPYTVALLVTVRLKLNPLASILNTHRCSSKFQRGLNFPWGFKSDSKAENNALELRSHIMIMLLARLSGCWAIQRLSNLWRHDLRWLRLAPWCGQTDDCCYSITAWFGALPTHLSS